MLSAICFNLDQSKILSSGNGLTDTEADHLKTSTLSQTQNFRLIQTGRQF